VILTVGSTVVYPCQGPCMVGEVVERSVAGEPRSFYHLIVLDDSGGELFVPVDKVQAIGIRPLSQRSDIPKLQCHLMKTVGSLTELSETKALSPSESRTLVRARKFLVCEISEVMRETKSAAEELVDQALRARKIAVVSGKPDYQPRGEFKHSM
jgi:RNA polymerase-interacting CarD/CdnL/TRCF family regulator